jgi:hypothetical protein
MMPQPCFMASVRVTDLQSADGQSFLGEVRRGDTEGTVNFPSTMLDSMSRSRYAKCSLSMNGHAVVEIV